MVVLDHRPVLPNCPGADPGRRPGDRSIGSCRCVILAFLPLLFFWRRSASAGWRARSPACGMRAMANVNSTIKETVSGIAVAKNFRQEASIFGEFDQANQQSYQVNVRRGFVLSLVFPDAECPGRDRDRRILVYVGGMSAAQGHRHGRRLVPFPAKPGPVFLPGAQPVGFLGAGPAGLSAAERVFALIDAESGLSRSTSSAVPVLKGEIRFRDVMFPLFASKEPVLEDFNLHIHPAKTSPWSGIPAQGNLRLPS